MSSRPELKLDWCSYAAAKYAVEHWHYSRTMPAGKNVYLGVWECGRYVGVVMFGLGSGRATWGDRYGLARSHEVVELTRVALRTHVAPVSRIIAIALRLTKRQSPGIRLVMSMADPAHGHHGGIYQSGGWVYDGLGAASHEYQLPTGRWVHHRSANALLGSVAGRPRRRLLAKHRYLYPLDAAMRAQLEPLRQPYPKRAGSIDSDAAGDQPAEGGASPTSALQS